MTTKKNAPKKSCHILLDDAARAMNLGFLSQKDAALLTLELVAYLGYDKDDPNSTILVSALHIIADGKEPPERSSCYR